jgi:LDH2 family malate/lactate/ureidoglycolate dehydrogenase
VSDGKVYRIDDLRRFASALAVAAGLSPARAAAFASHLLWFDTAGDGAPSFGLATLPDWLDRIEQGNVDPKAAGRVVSEHSGTAVIDGGAGLPPLILARASAVAGEKARDVGVGVVRVTGLGPTGPAAPLAAEMAIGPEVGCIVGPGPSWTLALPSAEGLPAIFDSALAGNATLDQLPGQLKSLVAPFALMTADESWLVVAIAVPALEPLATFHERTSVGVKSLAEAPGLLLPGPWEQRRAHAREHGLAIDESVMAELARRGERFGLTLPPAWDGRAALVPDRGQAQEP